MDDLPWFTKSDIVALCVSLSVLCLMGLYHLVRHVVRRGHGWLRDVRREG